MFFAVNPPHHSLPAQIAHEFAELSADLRRRQPHASLKLCALVDGAFDKNFFDARYPRTSPPRSLYADTSLKALGLAAPHLQSAPDTIYEVEAWLNHIFSVASGKPMVSIIASPLNIEEVALHMRPYLIAVTPDTVEWPIRWGDTRVLPTLLDVLHKSKFGHILAPLRCWWVAGREGKLLRWNGNATPPTAAGFEKLPLSDQEFITLIDASEPDAVLANLHDSQPDLFRSDSPANYHARVARHLELASASGIKAAPARQHFSALALILSDEFTKQTYMAGLLQRTLQGADYYNEIAALPDEFWQLAER